MFWKRKTPRPVRRIGPTGSGAFHQNIDFMFWDDISMPGLIDFERFSELGREVLSAKESNRWFGFRMDDSMVDWHGVKHYAAGDVEFAGEVLERLNAKLVADRERDPASISHWIVDNLFEVPDKEGVFSAGERWVSSSMTRTIRAYINCLSEWNYGYGWDDVLDGRGRPAVLVTKDGKPAATITPEDVMYIRGRPYRFKIETARRVFWKFDVADGRLLIDAMEGEPVAI